MAEKTTGNRTPRKTQSAKKLSQSPVKPGPVSIKTGGPQPDTRIHPVNTPATHTAQAPVPHASVTPLPRSQVRIVTSAGD